MLGGLVEGYFAWTKVRETHHVLAPEGNWYFFRDLAVPLVWSRKVAWVRYYDVIRADSFLHTFQFFFISGGGLLEVTGFRGS
jgi:hypothetical protein